MLISENYTTQDVSEAEESIGRVYRRGEICDSANPFMFSQRVVGDERATFARFQISAKTELAVDLGNVVGIGHLRGGSYRATSNGREVNPRDSFLLVPGEVKSWSESLDLLMVNLDLPQLAVYSGIERGTPHIRYQFDDLAPVSPRAALRWKSSVDYCQRILDDPVMLSNDLIRNAAIDVICALALNSFRISFPLTGAGASGVALPSSVRRAQIFIEDNAALPISVVDIAAAARLSVRGLQAAFRRNLGMTPQAYVRRVRLAAAHADLLIGNAGAVKVAEIARRWGFHHLSRFAKVFRAEFGESPSDTLRR